ncbi:MAG: type II secretion system GspH family protein [Candidatus Pacebacteria bacterium]|nr:type II secretion system GspH family protein [Candidatus Paceibacterota bacterium]
MISMNMKDKREGGFTLLELLIVISIIAILSVALVLVLNPAEALKKSRDAQRISDLSTMKTALGLYLTSTSSPRLDGGTNAACKATPTGAYVSGDIVYYSLVGAGTITDATIDGGNTSIPDPINVAVPALTDGNGWIPVNFDTLTGGSPISNLPVDPSNTFNVKTTQGGDDSVSDITSDSAFYRYACSASPLAFEIDAILESDAYTTGADDKRTTDGGNNSNFYEVGTNLRILGTSFDF